MSEDTKHRVEERTSAVDAPNTAQSKAQQALEAASVYSSAGKDKAAEMYESAKETAHSLSEQVSEKVHSAEERVKEAYADTKEELNRKARELQEDMEPKTVEEYKLSHGEIPKSTAEVLAERSRAAYDEHEVAEDRERVALRTEDIVNKNLEGYGEENLASVKGGEAEEVASGGGPNATYNRGSEGPMKRAFHSAVDTVQHHDHPGEEGEVPS